MTSGPRSSNSPNTVTRSFRRSGVSAPLGSVLASNDSPRPSGRDWNWRCRRWRNWLERTRPTNRRRSLRGDVARTELALRRRHRQSRGQATRTGLGRRRSAKDRGAAAQHVDAIRHDDDEVDHRHEDDEIDDRRDEGAHVDTLAVHRPPETLPRSATAGEGVDERRDDVVRERLDERAEGQRDDQAHGDHDQFALHQETLETLHGVSLVAPERTRVYLSPRFLSKEKTNRVRRSVTGPSVPTSPAVQVPMVEMCRLRRKQCRRS